MNHEHMKHHPHKQQGCTEATGTTAVAPTFSNILTLFQPEGEIYFSKIAELSEDPFGPETAFECLLYLGHITLVLPCMMQIQFSHSIIIYANQQRPLIARLLAGICMQCQGSHIIILFIHTANILLVKKATFRCLLFPMLFQCTYGSQKVLVVNDCIKCSEK